jgi:hypothetical protein
MSREGLESKENAMKKRNLLVLVADAFQDVEFELIASNLSHEQEAQLRESFGAQVEPQDCRS